MPGSSSSTADGTAPTAPSAATPRPQASRLRRALLNALALFLIYGNASIALQPPRLRRAGFELPAPRWLRDTFLMSGMFTTWSDTNLDMFIAGLRTSDGDLATRGQWIRIALRDHFPDRHGVTFTKLFAMHHWDALGMGAQQRAWKAMAQKIRERHGRLHPGMPVARVRFGSVQWPQSPQGYRAKKRPGALQTRTWYEERP